MKLTFILLWLIALPSCLASSIYEELNLAIIKKDYDKIERLAKNLGNVPKNVDGTHPVFTAITLENLKAIRIIVNSGVDINGIRDLGKTPLMFALQRKDPYSLVSELLELGASPNVVDNNDYTPLTVTIINSGKFPEQARLVELLLQNKADPNFYKKGRKPPLIWAVYEDNFQIVSSLLKHGADPNISYSDGNEFPLDAAISVADLKIVNALIKAGAEVKVNAGERLLSAIGNKQIISLLLKNGLDPDSGAAIVKCIEVRCGNEVIKLFIAHGANIDVKDDNGRTALITAVMRRELNVVTFLLNSGADKSIRYQNKTATEWAEHKLKQAKDNVRLLDSQSRKAELEKSQEMFNLLSSK